LYRAVLSKDPGSETARDELTALLALQQHWDEAIRVLLAGPDTPATRLKYAQLLLAHRDLDVADKVLRELEATSFKTGEVAHARAQWRTLRNVKKSLSAQPVSK